MTGLFLYPLKKQKKQKFPDVFTDYRKITTDAILNEKKNALRSGFNMFLSKLFKTRNVEKIVALDMDKGKHDQMLIFGKFAFFLMKITSFRYQQKSCTGVGFKRFFSMFLIP